MKIDYIFRRILPQSTLTQLVVALSQSPAIGQQPEAPPEEPEPELVSKRLRLSYVDPSRCVQLLRLHGFEVGGLDAPVDRSKLPVVILLPETKFHETIPDESKVFPHTETDPINEIMIFYDPSKPEQFGAVIDVVRKQIDLPARQIMLGPKHTHPVASQSQTQLKDIEKTLPLRVLSEAGWDHWITKGYVIVRQAVPSASVDRLVNLLWAFDEKDPIAPPASRWGYWLYIK